MSQKNPVIGVLQAISLFEIPESWQVCILLDIPSQIFYVIQSNVASHYNACLKELQIKGCIEDNSNIIFHIPQQKTYVVTPR